MLIRRFLKHLRLTEGEIVNLATWYGTFKVRICHLQRILVEKEIELLGNNEVEHSEANGKRKNGSRLVASDISPLLGAHFGNNMG